MFYDCCSDVIAIQSHGSIDVDLNEIPANELMQWGMQNLWEEEAHGRRYAIRYGNVPVSDFGASPSRRGFRSESR